ncbi:CDP-glycerol glycerophosphotransferase family protein [Leisingera sp. ANG-M1]|uniref:CDP-glycerol glycerophosphotransferase family protein n=1 Tax=Leisingera sp. ANG-M1 TaxID=1577895 RepID=UPI00187C3C2E|nr:CDP-glycerol glycerophosphotransferase family protein [Leisingera sp. ANG-M1]
MVVKKNPKKRAAPNGTALFFMAECSKRAPKRNIVVLSPGSFSGNSKYIYSHLHEVLAAQGLLDRLFWVTFSPKDAAILAAAGVRVHHAANNGPTAQLFSETAVVFVSTHHTPREDFCMMQAALSHAVKVQMWHGLPAKRVAYEVASNKKTAGAYAYFAFDCLSADYYVADSRYVADKRREAFPAAEILINSTPRIDMLVPGAEPPRFWKLGVDSDLLDKMQSVRSKGGKVALYAPTYREGRQKKVSFFREFRELVASAAASPETFLLIKNHPVSHDQEKLEEIVAEMEPVNVGFIERGHDVYPYLRETDVLITDYSSIYYDFLVTGRQVIFFRPDFEEYLMTRRIHDEQESGALLGFHPVTGEDCVAAIHAEEPAEYGENRLALKKKMFARTDGRASRDLVAKVFRKTGSPVLAFASPFPVMHHARRVASWLRRRIA